MFLCLFVFVMFVMFVVLVWVCLVWLCLAVCVCVCVLVCLFVCLCVCVFVFGFFWFFFGFFLFVCVYVFGVLLPLQLVCARLCVLSVFASLSVGLFVDHVLLGLDNGWFLSRPLGVRHGVGPPHLR